MLVDAYFSPNKAFIFQVDSYYYFLIIRLVTDSQVVMYILIYQ